VNYTYHFTATQHQTLASCLANNGVIALGLDSDCHFFNHGITCAMTLVPQLRRWKLTNVDPPAFR